MAANLRLDTCSTAADASPFHSSNHRSNFGGHNSTLERSASVRDVHEGSRVVAAGTGTGTGAGGGVPGNPSASTAPNGALSHQDNSSLLNVLWLDSLPVGEPRQRQSELRKAISVAVGAPMDATPGGAQPKHLHMQTPAEIKQLKACLTDNCTKARERVNKLGEAVTKLEKFQSGATRKRSRPDAGSYERTVSMERSGTAAYVSRGGPGFPTNHAGSSDSGMQKVGDKSRNASQATTNAAPNSAAPNKRMRTSLSLSAQRPLPDRERDQARLSSFAPSPVEDKDRSVPPNGDKAKMKGRRSGMKADVASGAVNNGPAEGERDLKWNAQQQRLTADTRSRPIDVHGFRPLREENPSPSPTVTTKAKAARAPRSGSGAGGSTVSHVPRGSYPGDSRERSSGTVVKCAQPTPLNNRKRPAPTRSSSPPTHWVGQRPPKMARIARRMINGAPGIPASREGSTSAEGSAGREASARPNSAGAPGSGAARRVGGPSTQVPSHSKPRSERNAQPVGPSESDESDEDNDKLKEKGRKHGIWDEKPVCGNQKMGNVTAQAKKTRVVPKEEVGDGIRRQGRSGRGPSTPRTGVRSSITEKVEGPVNAKQLRSTRVAVEKADSLVGRPGRPSLKKNVIDRKPVTRPRRPIGGLAGDLSGESDDDIEELNTAIKQAGNTTAACLNVFWKQVEPYFAFVSQEDLGFLRQQVGPLYDIENVAQIPGRGEQPGKVTLLAKCVPPVNPNVDIIGGRSVGISNGIGGIEEGMVKKLMHDQNHNHDGCKGPMRSVWVEKGFSIAQRLVAAIIHEKDIDDARRSQDGTCEVDGLGLVLGSPVGANSLIENNRADHEREEESDGDFGRHDLERWSKHSRESQAFDENGVSNGHGYSGDGNFTHSSELGEGDSVLRDAEVDVSDAPLEAVPSEEILRGGGSRNKEGKQDTGRPFGSVAGMAAWKFQWERMSVDERIQVELQSVGLIVEHGVHMGSREEDSCKELQSLQRECNNQACVNQVRIRALENTVRENDERGRERLVLSKYVELAYNRRILGGRGGKEGSSGGKGSSGKVARTTALAFAKRALDRVRRHEAGENCLYNAGLWDALNCGNPRETLSNIIPVRNMETDSPAQLGEVAANVPSGQSQLSAGAAAEGVGRLSSRLYDSRGKVDTEVFEGYTHSIGVTEHMKVKEEPWLSRVKEKEMLLEDVGQASVGHEFSQTERLSCLGGTKGKRSERDWGGKGQGQHQSHMKDTGTIVKGMRQGMSSVKGERKTKTKLRQKIASLPKGVNGLVGRSNEHHGGGAPFASQDPSGNGVGKGESVLSATRSRQESDEQVDLSHIAIPGIDEFGVSENWLDFEEIGLQATTGEAMMGLDVPMDDLSELHMMM